MKLKLQYSGWPSSCITDEDKDNYIDNVYEKEGIKLEKSEICHNTGLREQSKLMLNSFWGKFGQKNNLSSNEIVYSRAEFLKLMCDDTLIVERVTDLSEQAIMVTSKSKQEFIEEGTSSSVIIACFTAALARLKLYDLLYQLGDRAL